MSPAAAIDTANVFTERMEELSAVYDWGRNAVGLPQRE